MMRLLAIGVLTAWGSLAAAEVRYGPSLTAARWEQSGSRIACRLWQPVAGLGEVAFTQGAGDPLRFRLPLALRRPAVDAALLYTLPPAWNHRDPPRELGRVVIHGDTLTLEAGPARALLAELEQGRAPSLGFRDGAGEWVKVSLSPVGSREPLYAFLACGDGLLARGYEQLRVTEIFYPSASAELPAEARRELAAVAELMREDPGITGATIAGHADPVGSREANQQLAARRAGAVRELLAAQGVDPGRLSVEVVGEQGPDRRRARPDPGQRKAVVTLHR